MKIPMPQLSDVADACVREVLAENGTPVPQSSLIESLTAQNPNHERELQGLREASERLLAHVPSPASETNFPDPQLFPPMPPAPEDQSAFQKKLREAEQEFIAAGLNVQEIREKIAQLKEDLKAAEEMADALGVRLRGMRAGMPVQLELGDTPTTQDASPQASVTHLPTPYPSHLQPKHLPPPRWEPPVTKAAWWRYASIDELQPDTVQGMGKKKLQNLREGVPTIGHLEDCRLESIRSGVPVNKLLPKGIGIASAEELCERLLLWLSRNRERASQYPAEVIAAADADDAADLPQDPAVAEFAAAVALDMPVLPSLDATIETPLPSPAPACPSVAAAHEQDREHSDAEQQVLNRHAELLAMLPHERPVVDDDDQDFTFGRMAAQAGDPVTYCMSTEPGERQDAWLLGYIAEQQS